MTPPIISALDAIADRYDALFCDLWGCLHNGLTPYPAAVAALQRFRARGGAVVLMTNAPRSADLVARHLAGMGVPGDCRDAIVSSGDAALNELREGRFGSSTLYVGPERDRDFAQGLPIPMAPVEHADSVFCVGLRDDDVETPEDYAVELADWHARGLPMLCANPDVVVDRGDQRLYCAGALAAAYQAIGGTVRHCGKPHPPIYRLGRQVLARLGRAEARILAVGDGLATDIAGGVAEGIDSLFVTGGLFAEAAGTDPDHPDPARLPALLHGQPSPTWVIGRLR